MRWLSDGAPDCDVVVSTRIRLARNIAKLPFPSRISSPEDIEKVHSAAKQSFLKAAEFSYMHLSELSMIERRVLIEGHIISNELSDGQNGGLITNKIGRAHV